MATIEFNNEKSINARLSHELSINAKVKNLNYIPDYKKYEEERQNNELEREAYINELKQRVLNGEFNGPQGLPGKDGRTGRGITNVTKIKSEGLVDTYQIDYSDGTNTMISIKNGKDGDQEVFIGDESLFDKESTQVILINPDKKTTSDTAINDGVNDTAEVTIYGKSVQAISTNPVMPSPDYPSEIENVKGKNLLDNKNPNYIVGATWQPTETGGKFSASTTWKHIGWKCELNTDKQYTFSYGARNSNNLYLYICTYTDDTYATIKTRIVSDGIKLQNTFKPDSKYVTIHFANNTVIENIEIPNIQLEKNSTATRYVPYGNIQIVETGKNLLNVTAESFTVSGVTVTINPDKTIVLNGTYTGTNIGWRRLAPDFTIPSGTYTISNGNPNSSTSTALFKDDSNNFDIVNISTKTFTEEKVIKPYLRIAVGSSFNNFKIYPMFVAGDVVGEYKPYTEEVVNIDLKGNELCSLPNGTKDELIVKDGRAKVVKRIGKVVLDGSENWGQNANQTKDNTSYYYTYALDNLVKGTSQLGTLISNYFINQNTYDTDNEGISLSAAIPFLRLRINTSTDPTLADFKTWLSTHNTIVQYELATPTEIDLGEVTTLKTFNGTTYITNSEDAEMEITYTSNKLPKVKYKNDVGNLLDLVPNNYTLPTASATTLGGIKVGSGLTINDGVLSATGGGTADAVNWENVTNKPTKLTDFTNDLAYKTAYDASTNKIATESDLAIKTLVGTSTNPITLSSLESGLYEIYGTVREHPDADSDEYSTRIISIESSGNTNNIVFLDPEYNTKMGVSLKTIHVSRTGNAYVSDHSYIGIDTVMTMGSELGKNFADPYDESKNYAVGDVVTYTGVLFKVMNTISSGTDFYTAMTNDLVQQIDIFEVIDGKGYQTADDVETAITAKKYVSNTTLGKYFQQLGVFNLAPAYDSSKSYAVGDIFVTEGVLCRVTKTLAANVSSEVFIDSVEKPTVFGVIDSKGYQTTDVYSTSEVKTNKVWIDGSPIYRKVISKADVSSSNITIPHGISNLGITFLPEVTVTKGEGISYFPYNSNYDFKIEKVDTNYVYVSGNSGFTNWTIYITLEYTKTADSGTNSNSADNGSTK